MRVRAKFSCNRVTEFTGGYKSVEFNAVHSTTGENKDFAEATPSGKLELSISPGRPAADAFKPGKEYYLDITPVDEAQ